MAANRRSVAASLGVLVILVKAEKVAMGKAAASSSVAVIAS
jgi:hypothetical protein